MNLKLPGIDLDTLSPQQLENAKDMTLTAMRCCYNMIQMPPESITGNDLIIFFYENLHNLVRYRLMWEALGGGY